MEKTNMKIFFYLLFIVSLGTVGLAQSFQWSNQRLQQQNGEILFINGSGKFQLLGSAFVFGKSNYVVTCYHVWNAATNLCHTTNLYYNDGYPIPFALTPKCFFATNDTRPSQYTLKGFNHAKICPPSRLPVPPPAGNPAWFRRRAHPGAI